MAVKDKNGEDMHSGRFQSGLGSGDMARARACDNSIVDGTLDIRASATIDKSSHYKDRSNTMSDIPVKASCKNVIPVSYVATIVDNVRSMRALASEVHSRNGARWYRRTAQYCFAWARAFNAAGWHYITPLHIGAVLAAHSSNTPWDRNIALASRHLRMMLYGTARVCRSRVSIVVVGDDGSERKRSVKCPHYGTGALHPVHTLGENTDKAERIMHATDADAIARVLSPDGDNIKTVAFAYACSGDYSHAVIDRHAHRIAYGYAHCKRNGRPCADNGRHNCGWVPVRDEYRTIAHAYAVVASEYGEPVAFTQAITWVATREFNA